MSDHAPLPIRVMAGSEANVLRLPPGLTVLSDPAPFRVGRKLLFTLVGNYGADVRSVWPQGGQARLPDDFPALRRSISTPEFLAAQCDDGRVAGLMLWESERYDPAVLHRGVADLIAADPARYVVVCFGSESDAMEAMSSSAQLTIRITPDGAWEADRKGRADTLRFDAIH